MKLSFIAQMLGASLNPSDGPDPDIEGIAAPGSATERHITFLSKSAFREAVAASR